MSALRCTNVQSGVVVGSVGQTFSTLLNYNSPFPPPSSPPPHPHLLRAVIVYRGVSASSKWVGKSKSAEQLYLYRYIQAI